MPKKGLFMKKKNLVACNVHTSLAPFVLAQQVQAAETTTAATTTNQPATTDATATVPATSVENVATEETVVPAAEETVEAVIIHTNDVHGRILEERMSSVTQRLRQSLKKNVPK